MLIKTCAWCGIDLQNKILNIIGRILRKPTSHSICYQCSRDLDLESKILTVLQNDIISTYQVHKRLKGIGVSIRKKNLLSKLKSFNSIQSVKVEHQYLHFKKS